MHCCAGGHHHRGHRHPPGTAHPSPSACEQARRRRSPSPAATPPAPTGSRKRCSQRTQSPRWGRSQITSGETCTAAPGDLPRRRRRGVRLRGGPRRHRRPECHRGRQPRRDQPGVGDVGQRDHRSAGHSARRDAGASTATGTPPRPRRWDAPQQALTPRRSPSPPGQAPTPTPTSPGSR